MSVFAAQTQELLEARLAALQGLQQAIRNARDLYAVRQTLAGQLTELYEALDAALAREGGDAQYLISHDGAT